MDIRQLEANLRAKQAEVKARVEAIMRACQDHVVAPATATSPEVRGREMTAEERSGLDALMAEGRALRAQIDRARGDADLLAAVDALTNGLALAPVATAPAVRGVRSLGAQFVADAAYRAWLKNGGHRVTGGWTSPAVEVLAATLTSDPASGGALIVPDTQTTVMGLPVPRVVVADLIAPGTTQSNLVQYMKEKQFINAAAPVAEGDPKPESTLIFEMAQAPVRKLAHWIPVSEEMLEDSAQTRSIIDARLTLGLSLEEEDQLLNGTGVAPELLGFNKLPGLAPPVARTGTDSNIDAIFKQQSAIASTSFIVPDGTVLNPANWGAIQLLKTANGEYLAGGPWGTTPATLWGVRVAVTPAQPVNTAITGGFRSAAQLFRRDGIRIEASNSHANFFVQNLVAIRGEERLALAVYREGAFGQVTGLTGGPPPGP